MTNFPLPGMDAEGEGARFSPGPGFDAQSLARIDERFKLYPAKPCGVKGFTRNPDNRRRHHFQLGDPGQDRVAGKMAGEPR